MENQIEIIAELAQGFEGSFLQAKLLIKAAASAKADVAKLQLIYADELATPDYKHYELFQTLEMNDNDWEALNKYASELNIKLYLDVFGIKGLQLCEKIGVEGIKLHGTDIANIGLLNEVRNSSVGRIYLGAGGAYLSEIEQAINILNNKEVIVLLGFQSYPTNTQDNQIDRVKLLKNHLDSKFTNSKIGFADHEDPNTLLKYCLATCAVGAGATVIEKHLTLGKNMMLEDHESALNSDEFLEFSDVVRKCFSSLGTSTITQDFGMSKSEDAYRKMIRRHVVASKNLVSGSIISSDDLVLKRTSSVDFITDINDVYEKTLIADVEENKALSFLNFK